MKNRSTSLDINLNKDKNIRSKIKGKYKTNTITEKRIKKKISLKNSNK